MDDGKILTELKKRMSEGASGDELVLFLREGGLSQGASSFFLQHAGYGSHLQCKVAVLESRVWAEAYEANRSLHTQIDSFVEE